MLDARLLILEDRYKSSSMADATLDGNRKEHMELLSTVPLLNIDDLGMRKLPLTAAEELLEIIMRQYERASTLITSNRPVEDWGKLLGDGAAVTAMLDRLLYHGHVLKCGPLSWRTKTSARETTNDKGKSENDARKGIAPVIRQDHPSMDYPSRKFPEPPSRKPASRP